MPAETTDDISVAPVIATSTPDPSPPVALAETAVWARHLWDRWWLMPICATVVAPSARSGTYCTIDFLLMLLLHACGPHERLRETLREAGPFAGTIMALWARHAMPSQSQLSRWLARLDELAVRAFRTLFCPTSVAMA
ncbi:MAG: hypothetical protein Q7U78_09530 [Gallionella sp.]|nr:hypothetical protein [Gallionella sp.]